MVLDDSCAGVESDRRTNVPWDTIEAVSDLKLVRFRSFDDKMFFTVSERGVIREIEKLHAWVWHF